MLAIETRGLTRSYGRHRGIEDLDLEVPRGQVFGFLGPNGSGKTTTIRVLLDFLRPSSGRAQLLGLASHRDSVEIHRRTGYLPGDPALYDRITARELLGWFARLRGTVDRAYLDGLVARFGIDLDRPIHHLSRGNRQKVALVPAFMHRPELIVLDEPTSGLDPLVQREFQALCREVVAEGATVFLSSHVLDEVQHLCERVAIIRDGRIVATEAVDDLRAAAVHDVAIRFRDDFAVEDFGRVPGVRGPTAVGDTLHLQLVGDADPLVKLVARHDVADFVSTPADLDTLLLRYYQEDTDDPARH